MFLGKAERCASAVDAFDLIKRLYDQSADNLRGAFKSYIDDGIPPSAEDRRAGAFCYPRLAIEFSPRGPIPRMSKAFGVFTSPGLYVTEITQPDMFRNYLIEQIDILLTSYECEVLVGLSDVEIPYPYVLEGGAGIDVDVISPSELAYIFPVPNLSDIDDRIADGQLQRPLEANPRFLSNQLATKPLHLFPGLRTDYSLQRLKHYSGTQARDFQSFILFTNYQRYMDEFVDLAMERIATDSRYEKLVGPGSLELTDPAADTSDMKAVARGKYQMPAYHLVAEGGQGITLINIGVGPSNAKTITDHLAVLRPHCWLMIGHCGGLRHSQLLGDYVLAHAYLRYDGVLDNVLAPEVPIPPIAEIQQALGQAIEQVSSRSGSDVKERLRTGTVVTNDDRNWELRFRSESGRFNQSRAIAIDMESATLAANGYRFRVPYGTLLCVSDKPLHGEIKLPGSANRFYERAIAEHMLIGVETLEILHAGGTDALHSRKLRSFDEPPFR